MVRCLRCNGALRPFRRKDFPGKEFGQIVDEAIALWCDECGMIYDDWGQHLNRIRILRIVPDGVCRECGETGLFSSGVDEDVKCAVCGKDYVREEFGWFATVTRGWVNQVKRKKMRWSDAGKKFVKVEGW